MAHVACDVLAPHVVASGELRRRMTELIGRRLHPDLIGEQRGHRSAKRLRRDPLEPVRRAARTTAAACYPDQGTPGPALRQRRRVLRVTQQSPTVSTGFEGRGAGFTSTS